MKALGIAQPQAWLIINEYISRVKILKKTGYRGSVLIYATPDLVSTAEFSNFTEQCRQLRVASYPKKEELDYGGFIGTATLVGCEKDESGNAIAIFDSAIELGFSRFMGESGLFDVEHDPFKIAPPIKRMRQKRDKVAAPRKKGDSQVSSRESAKKTPQNEPSQDSYAGHFFDGVEDQLKSSLKKNLRKIGGAVAKDVLSIGSEIITGLLNGEKPSKTRRR